ncbi:CRISPR-associated ring nuclease Crn3/Csx3 [Pyrococcus kukulkanii]|uniref:CRISPR-associated ring nuclease Crn3/Csx3 n=1 Tax=Pyrococcus kukulkanii TaxID=1609559 RepID=A0ABV4T7M8_9EURY
MAEEKGYTIQVKESEDRVVVEFSLAGPITPEEALEIAKDIEKAIIPKYAHKLVIVSGRGPIWLYGIILHSLHPVKALATLDPRLGAVVVQSHSTEYKEGQVIPLE